MASLPVSSKSAKLIGFELKAGGGIHIYRKSPNKFALKTASNNLLNEIRSSEGEATLGFEIGLENEFEIRLDIKFEIVFEIEFGF